MSTITYSRNPAYYMKRSRLHPIAPGAEELRTVLTLMIHADGWLHRVGG
jgi:hypothetical protein